MFGSENLKIVTHTIEVDPGATDKYFHLFKAPRELTIKRMFVVAAQTQNAGTAIQLRLENWGTAGTSVVSSGTVTAYLGGTAVAARLTALTPATATVDTTADNITANQWLVLHYAEEGAGWISGDRIHAQIEYVDGLGA